MFGIIIGIVTGVTPADAGAGAGDVSVGLYVQENAQFCVQRVVFLHTASLSVLISQHPSCRERYHSNRRQLETRHEGVECLGSLVDTHTHTHRTHTHRTHTHSGYTHTQDTHTLDTHT